MSVREITRQVANAAATARKADSGARTIGDVMRTLPGAVARIGDVASLIADIAGRTNFLALNATIEAARAGDAGRGFAVVGGDVKTLATQTATATEQIAAQIAAISESSGAITAAVEEQQAATGEIVRGVRGAAGGVADVAAGIAALTAMTLGSRTTAGGLAGAVGRLETRAVSLQDTVGGLVRDLRAA